MSRWAPTRRRWVAAAGAFSLMGGLAIAATPAAAVNVDQGTQVVSTTPVAFTPQVMNGSVNAITQVGNTIIAAGTFTDVRQTATSADIVRNHIFAFDATTGAVDMTFNPNLNKSVNSLDNDGTSIYAGGDFTTSNGAAAKRVAKFSATGALLSGSWKGPNSKVTEVVVRNGKVYVGGGFTKIGTTARAAFAALNASTGAVLADNLPFAGTFNGGNTSIARMDAPTDGSTIVAVGNFLTVNGLDRQQIVKLDLDATGVMQVSSWHSSLFNVDANHCAGVFDSWMRDIDFSPNGAYFVVSTTGAFAGGASTNTMCDSTSRWETSHAGDDQQPTWRDYTGGDTTYGVAVTGAAVYTGGHFRWQNNPYQGDQAGPGAVPRQGIAALDPVNGLPLSWNPGRTRGVGAQALYATASGLWVGSDTTMIGGKTRNRIALMPLAGGTTIPTVNPAVLPNDLFLAQRPGPGNTNVLYRVNGGGPAVQSSDSGPDWASDSGFVTGGSSADWGASVPFDSTIPAGTSATIFNTEHYGSMHWAFPVAVGKSVTVRLFFANQYSGTASVGQRVFNVTLDGSLVLNHFDIIAATGDHRATMRSFNITSDGEVDVDFGAITENPLVNGIEIIDTSAGAPTPTPGVLLRRPVDASGSPTAAATTANTAIDWSLVRGAFLLNGTLFYGLGDGGLYSRTFDKTAGAVGVQQTVNLNNDPDDGGRIPFAIANLTGIFYDPGQHRLYYTLFNDSTLYYRYFTPESLVVGAQTFVADNAGVDLSTVSGMTLAGGNMLYGSTADGALRSVTFGSNGITGSPSVVSNDGTWKSRAMFVPNS